ncbi:AAA family ATPase [Aureibacter tunicatorum]|uniref:Kinase n=1 Tax=Aureibacter tunicatorum TaxID=866807 RepID=A0AAE4BV01_9BACT|nr:AAA family ATPase [Aureibacter tunicatorum]MDR6241288.1 putative kinase [Aureibacter tunicatorum]BDD03548.1 hypothetical protein AUTU_10310 [Aureibacter tunicatorum]
MSIYLKSDWKKSIIDISDQFDLEVLAKSYKWVERMKGVPQDGEWHAEGDVFVHTDMVVKSLLSSNFYQSLEMLEKQVLAMSAVMHDIEKVSTTEVAVIDGRERIISPKHALKGEKRARSILYRDFEVPFRVREMISKLVRLHGLPIWAIEKKNAAKDAIKSSLMVDTRLLAELARADIRGRICRDAEEIMLKIDLYEELCKENDCWGVERKFASQAGKFDYFQGKSDYADYLPFENFGSKVIMMSGLPGSGKDTYISKNFDLPVVSLDDIRRKLKISPTDSKGNGRVIQEAKSTVKEYLRKKQAFVFNATNITSDMRGRWVDLFTTYNAWIEMVYVEVPYAKLLKQNNNREFAIPQAALEKMIDKLDIPDATEAHEVVYAV